MADDPLKYAVDITNTLLRLKIAQSDLNLRRQSAELQHQEFDWRKEQAAIDNARKDAEAASREAESNLKSNDAAWKVYDRYRREKNDAAKKYAEWANEAKQARRTQFDQQMDLLKAKQQGAPKPEVLADQLAGFDVMASRINSEQPKAVSDRQARESWGINAPTLFTVQGAIGPDTENFYIEYAMKPPEERPAVLAKWKQKFEQIGGRIDPGELQALKDLSASVPEKPQYVTDAEQMLGMSFPDWYAKSKDVGLPAAGAPNTGSPAAPSTGQPVAPQAPQVPDFMSLLSKAPDSSAYTIGPGMEVAPHTYTNIAFEGLDPNMPYLKALKQKQDDLAKQLAPLLGLTQKPAPTETPKEKPSAQTPIAPKISMGDVKLADAKPPQAPPAGVGQPAPSPPATGTAKDYTPVIQFFKSTVPDKNPQKTLQFMDPMLDFYAKESGRSRHELRNEWVGALRQYGWTDLK